MVSSWLNIFGPFDVNVCNAKKNYNYVANLNVLFNIIRSTVYLHGALISRHCMVSHRINNTGVNHYLTQKGLVHSE